MTKEEADDRQAKIKKAKEGCDVCPCCGETKKYYQFSNPFCGIEEREEYVSPFTFKKIAIYKCRTCGAKWQSDKYLP